MSLKLYGLKNCDTCRKALKALSAAGRAPDFVDVRSDEVSAEQIAAWAGALGWEKLLNTKSTTWRGLSEAEKQGVDEPKAVALMAEHTTLVKRPVIEADGNVTVGWSADVQASLGLG